MAQIVVVEIDENGSTVPLVCAFFPDAEMDVFMVEYSIEGDIVLHCEGVTHITTGPEQLSEIVALQDSATSLNDELSELYNDEIDGWADYQHLLTPPPTS